MVGQRAAQHKSVNKHEDVVKRSCFAMSRAGPAFYSRLFRIKHHRASLARDDFGNVTGDVPGEFHKTIAAFTL